MMRVATATATAEKQPKPKDPFRMPSSSSIFFLDPTFSTTLRCFRRTPRLRMNPNLDLRLQLHSGFDSESILRWCFLNLTTNDNPWSFHDEINRFRRLSFNLNLPTLIPTLSLHTSLSSASSPMSTERRRSLDLNSSLNKHPSCHDYGPVIFFHVIKPK